MLGSLFELSISQAPEFTKVDSSTFIHLRRNSNGINRGWPWPVIWERALILSTHLNTRQASKSFETTDWSWSSECVRIFAFIFKGSPKKEKQALSIVDKLQSITTSRGAALGMGSCRFFLISRDFH